MIFIAEIKKNLFCFLITYTWFMDIFLKFALDQFLPYRPYDHKIILESNKKELTYNPLYKINVEKDVSRVLSRGRALSFRLLFRDPPLYF
jgi:hypothetical protein